VLEGLDLANVGPWLEANVEGAVGPFEASLIGGGRSNLTFTVVGSDGTKFVLRRPPLGHVLATAHDMAREFKIIAAVGKTNVPVPPALGLCTDVDVNGAPFYVMGHVEGVVLDNPEKAAQLDPALRTKASDDLIDVLADLHAVDIDEIGLGDLARREGYIERQVKRWSTQWANSKTRELPAIDEVAKLLGERLPVQQGAVIAHGDYRFGNCLTDPDVGRIAARRAATTTRRAPVGSRRTRTSSSATPAAPGATSAASTTTSRSRPGGWRSSARASTPGTCTERWATRA
jgi:aminoglycoside phosphotransferase (APT) family kinase protein